MAETPSHGYNLPDAGIQDWHEPLNANFDAFEVYIEPRDEGAPDANGYDPADGANYLDITTGDVYLADGNGWLQEVSFGGESSGISSLTGGDGIDPTSIGDGDTLSAAWGDASSLDASGDIADFSAAADLDASGSITADLVEGLSGGDGIDPDSIGDGDTLSVVTGDLTRTFLSTDWSNNLTVDAGSGLEGGGSGILQASLGNALGFDGSTGHR